MFVRCFLIIEDYIEGVLKIAVEAFLRHENEKAMAMNRAAMVAGL